MARHSQSIPQNKFLRSKYHAGAEGYSLLYNALIAAEQRIGELLLAIPKAQGKRTDLQTSGHNSPEVKTKAEAVSRMGYGEREAKDYQQMAKNPDLIPPREQEVRRLVNGMGSIPDELQP